MVLTPPAGAVDVKSDDFWDYDRQVDLEGFSSGRVYDTLSLQARGVTQAISKHKDDMKLCYQRIADQTDSLKGKHSRLHICAQQHNMSISFPNIPRLIYTLICIMCTVY